MNTGKHFTQETMATKQEDGNWKVSMTIKLFEMEEGEDWKSIYQVENAAFGDSYEEAFASVVEATEHALIELAKKDLNEQPAVLEDSQTS